MILLVCGTIPVVRGEENESGGKANPPVVSTARETFVELPVSVLDILNRSTRLDMLDYWDADSTYTATNTMGGTSRIVSLTPDFMEVELTSVSTLQIRMLDGKKGDGKIVMTVYTVGGDNKSSDSEVRFFNSSLQPLESGKILKRPELKDFIKIPKGSATKFREIEEMVPFPTIELSASEGNSDLTGKLTVGTYMNLEDAKLVEMFTIPERVWKWEKGKYRLQK